MTMLATRLITTAAALALLPAAALPQTGGPVEQGPKNVPEFEPAFENQTRAPAADSGVALDVEVLADGLAHPWGVAPLPSGEILVTERPGRLRVVSPDGSVSDPVGGLPEVLAEKQGGLLDVAPGPEFAENRMIYWTYAKPMEDGLSATAAARGRLSEDMTEVTEVEDIFVQSPPSPSPMHYGSRVLFDGAGHALVTTGEHFTMEERAYAQDLDKTYGKTIRVALDGAIPDANPFVGEDGVDPAILSYGHRNIQGAAMRPETEQFWVIEHGPKGGDELNLVEPGANYGWPVVSYGETYDGNPVGSGEPRMEGMAEPQYYWDPVIAPGGMLFYEGDAFADWKGDLLIASLVPGALVRLEMDGDRVAGEERLLPDRGRIRDVAETADGAILAIVDAEDGALLRLTPSDG
jgi:glucose/arabinose dehydrogenase